MKIALNNKILVVMVMMTGVILKSNARDFVLSKNKNNDYKEVVINSPKNLSKIIFEDNDIVNIACDSVWYEKLHINVSKEVKKYILIRPDKKTCNNSRPEISGLNVAYANNFNSTLYFMDGNKKIIAVFDGDKKNISEVRVPALKLLQISQQDAISYGVAGNRAQFSIKKLTEEFSGMDFSGSKIVAKTEDWKVEERTVVEYDPIHGTLILDAPFHYVPRVGVEIYFKGLPWMLDWSKGWVIEKNADGSQLLHLSPDLAKDQPIIYYSTNEPNITINGAAKISGIKSTFSGDVGLLSESKFLEITDSEFYKNNTDGVRIKNLGSVHIRDSVFSQSGRDAIRVTGGEFVEVIRNSISNTGNVGEITDTVAAINVEGVPSSHIEENIINDSGYSGIRIRYHAYVKNNVIINSCLWLDDCGAIYSWNRTTPELSSNSVLENNKISGVFGREESRRLRTKHRKIAAGIYLDEKTNGFFVINNDISNVSQGIFMGGSTNNFVHKNKFYDYEDCGVCVYESREKKGEKYVSSIVVNDNYFGKSAGAVLSTHGAVDDILQPIFIRNKSQDDAVHWHRRKGRRIDSALCQIGAVSVIECDINN
jgi:parallel beta-helix repeat protein